MTNQNFIGWETGGTLEGTTPSGTTLVTNVTVHSGTYALECNPVGAAVGYHLVSGGFDTGGLPANLSVATLYTSFYFRFATIPASNDEEMFVSASSGAVDKLVVRINSAGKLVAYDSAASSLGTGTTVLSSGTWYLIDVKCGTGASAAWEVRINGVSELSGSTANLGVANNASVIFGKHTNKNGNTVDYFFDDAAWDDAAYPGAQQTTVLVPNANGNYQAWSIGAGSGSHYQVVDEIPLNSDTDYLVATALNQAETEAFTDTATAGITGTVNAVKIVTLNKRVGSNGTITVRARSGSTDSDNAATTTSTSQYAGRMRFMTTDPATSSAWTLSGVDGLEGGLVEKDGTNLTRMSAVYAMVNWSAQTSTSIAPTAGSLALSGAAPTLIAGTVLSPSVAALVLSGASSILGFAIPLAAGSLTLSGNAPSAIQGRVTTPTAGTLSVAGNSPTLIFGHVTTPTAGATSLLGLGIPSSAGTLSISGGTPAFSINPLLVFNTLSTVVGSTTLDITPSWTDGVSTYTVNYYLSLIPSFSPGPGTLIATHTGVVGLTDVLNVTSLSPATDYYAYVDITDSVGTVVNSGIVHYKTQDARFPTNATLTLSGGTPGVAGGTIGTLVPVSGILSLVGSASVLDLGVLPTRGVLTLTGTALSLSMGTVVVPNDGPQGGSGSQESLDFGFKPDSGGMVLTGQVPGATDTTPGLVRPTAGSLTMSGYAVGFTIYHVPLVTSLSVSTSGDDNIVKRSGKA